MHERERLRSLDVIENHDAPIERPRILIEPSIIGGARRSDDLGTRPDAGYAIGWDGADVDVGEIFALGIGVPSKVAHARAVNRRSIGEVAEGNPHRFNAVQHRQQSFYVLIRDDNRHVLLSPSLLGPISVRPP